MVQQHLGDFPARLMEHNTSKYAYCPIPGISYERLDKEMFCHNYYLDNLCDETRFPNWPIHEPVSVFRASMQRWTNLSRQSQEEEETSVEDARALLSLTNDATESDLRRAYRKVARKYHPDKVRRSTDTKWALWNHISLFLIVNHHRTPLVAKCFKRFKWHTNYCFQLCQRRV